ncbi:antitoxin VapB family protein [Halalkalicoccus sp. NIPERK01]|uniref:antitoxin VapB family protein n=1 Tax=Halalkalicoccus sp. NIPERK01 TaxID=3053469 RepID=UPI00256F50B2|nr:antitoxin VapB family protein [Halalkalicoccus sp. NIPERK01]MDL5363434.1 antitoxin VapB family protein [Halalkalicoccus sp. NIPERK01]
MRTKTISLTEEASERLEAAKKDGESFSDVVNRISPGVRLENHCGPLTTRRPKTSGRRSRRGENTDGRPEVRAAIRSPPIVE